MDRWSLQVPDRIVTVSLATKEQLLRRGVPGQRIAVVHNAVRTRHPVRAEASLRQRKIDLGVSPDEKLILCIGRLSKEKAQIDMVGAVASVEQDASQSGVRLMILGDGPERERITQEIQSAGLEKHVTLAGHLKDLTPYYEAADVVAIPSLSEGSPNVLLEAMALGVPVVATRVGGIPEIVAHEETALLIAGARCGCHGCGPRSAAVRASRCLGNGRTSIRKSRKGIFAGIAGEFSGQYLRRRLSLSPPMIQAAALAHGWDDFGV